jgi:diaminohydroxyphosphoribosylaminopyrimidine deaminase/5-amino-6-(5-phosphoribosylamino)uracil reductase
VDASVDQHWLDRAARLAVRGHGGAEPNPLVGCIVIDAGGDVAGSGYHRQAGGPHAEVVALQAAGPRAAGGTLYVTLEPCSHHGRTPPCTDAIVAAGIDTIVYGATDPHPEASGGADVLDAAGLDVRYTEATSCTGLLAPFAWRLRTGLPWVTAKWAQTIDGRIATRTGHSQWISGDRSRRLVHRERGRVDAIMTGIGTVKADNPMLTARDVTIRRTAARVIVDPRAELAIDSALVRTASETPVIALCLPTAPSPRIETLREHGVHVHIGSETTDRLNLAEHLKHLSSEHGIATMLVEAGPGLLSSLLEDNLLNELAVFIAPMLMSDDQATPPLRGNAPPTISDTHRLTLIAHHRRGEDVVMRYLLTGLEPRADSAS